MTACRSIQAELGAYHDGVLEAGVVRAELERHLVSCESCQTELARLDALDSAIRALPRFEPSPTFASRVYAEIERTSQAPSPRALGARRPARRAGWMRASWTVGGLAAAALALVMLRGQDPDLSGEDWQIVANDQDTFDLLMNDDPDMLYSLDLLERWDDDANVSQES